MMVGKRKEGENEKNRKKLERRKKGGEPGKILNLFLLYLTILGGKI